jgi:hypothetical protein
MTFWPERWSDVSATLSPFSKNASEGGVGCLDEVGLVIDGGQARGWYLRGWAALSRKWSAHSDLSVVLIHPRCSYEVGVCREPRDDVAQAFDRAALGHSGYRALIPLEPLLEGDHAIAIRMRTGDEERFLHTGQVLRVHDGRARLPELQTESWLQVVHVPKSAGTSFQKILNKAFGDAMVLHYGPRFVVGQKTRCIQGHCSAPNYASFAPNIRRIMWFRDPVERVVSEYFHWRRHPDIHALEGADLLSFACRKEMVNIYRRALDGVALSALECVCIAEQFQVGIELFRRMFGMNVEDGQPQNINPDKEVGSRYELPDGVRQQIELANMADLELYAAAKERFAELCGKYGIVFAAPHASATERGQLQREVHAE